MKKAEIRNLFLSQRQSLAVEQIQVLDQQILNHFRELNLSGVQYLHLFLPILAKKEVDTYAIAAWLKENHPQIELVLSKSNLEEHTLSHFIWNEQTQLAENKWGITEPQGGSAISASELDMVLVPLLGFDERGHRVGYGKGFYDRFLAECNPQIQKIGLSLFEPVAQIDDTSDFDIPLDACITPNRIWYF